MCSVSTGVSVFVCSVSTGVSVFVCVQFPLVLVYLCIQFPLVLVYLFFFVSGGVCVHVFVCVFQFPVVQEEGSGQELPVPRTDGEESDQRPVQDIGSNQVRRSGMRSRY